MKKFICIAVLGLIIMVAGCTKEIEAPRHTEIEETPGVTNEGINNNVTEEPQEVVD